LGRAAADFFLPKSFCQILFDRIGWAGGAGAAAVAVALARARKSPKAG
jgi:hypothetical protein